MRLKGVFVGCLMLGLSGCTLGQDTIPEQLKIKPGTRIAGYDGLHRLERCGVKDRMVVEVRGNLVKLNEGRWLNLASMSNIRVCHGSQGKEKSKKSRAQRSKTKR